MGMKELNQAAQRNKPAYTLPDNKPIEANSPDISGRHRRRTPGPRFEETHVRFTSYFRNDVYERIEELRDVGKITNLKTFINDALQKYLDLFF